MRTMCVWSSCGLSLLALSLTACVHTVSVMSVPPGAHVRETTRGDLGVTSSRPLMILNVPRGSTLDLYISKDGFDPQFVSLTNIRGDRDVLAILEAPVTTLWVGSMPPAARIAFHDMEGRRLHFQSRAMTDHGVDYANQTYVLPSNISRLYVSLEKTGYERLRRRVFIQPGQENRHSFTLMPQQTLISVETDPQGAEVFERRLNLLGITPFYNLNLPYERLRRLHTEQQESLNLILTISKLGYQTENIIHPIALFTTNRVLQVRLEPEPSEVKGSTR